jgi:hypothetical protein
MLAFCFVVAALACLPPNPQNGGTFFRAKSDFINNQISFHIGERKLPFTKLKLTTTKVPPFWGLGGEQARAANLIQ